MMRQLFTILILFAFALPADAKGPIPTREEGEVLSMAEFVRFAAQNDTEFEQILIDELQLQYRKDLNLPAGDLVLSVKQEYEWYFSDDRGDPDTTIELFKLFPYQGTELTVEYDVSSSFTSSKSSSSLSFTLAQPIAENAFGRTTRLRNKIIGLEVDVAKHQITEAYEDYLATVLTTYYDWYEAYENYLIGESSYRENLKLLNNIKEREKHKIAKRIDVNKITLQVLSKKESLVELEEIYHTAANNVRKIVRMEDAPNLIPGIPEMYAGRVIDYDVEYAAFKEMSRTYKILKLLKDQSSLQVERDADDLLPSIDLLIGYEIRGEEYSFNDEENMFFTGLQFDWPVGDQVERAEHEVSKIEKRKRELINNNAYYRLYTQIHNLSYRLERERRLLEIAEERIKLAQSVLDDETENYSFGRVTLNDYIQAVNALDSTRFNLVFHEAQYRRQVIEWLRLTDQLINRKDINLK